jgi:hypothetical protein
LNSIKAVHGQKTLKAIGLTVRPSLLAKLRLPFAAVQESGVGPLRRFAAMQRDVGHRGQTGRSANTARTDALDPKQNRRGRARQTIGVRLGRN